MEDAGMTARERVWAWIEAERGGPGGSHVLHVSPRQISAETGIGLEWVKTIIEQWCDEGCLIRIERGRYRIVETPKPEGFGFTRHPVWSEEARGKLAELSARGLTLSEMARELKSTVNAIAGQRKRMGLSKRPSPIRVSQP
jgi:DNA-binding transcriptional regulator YhcF (GntR family)